MNYGQRTEARELRAFNEIADFYRAEKRLTVSIRAFEGHRRIGPYGYKHPHTGNRRPQSTIRNPQSAIPTTYVPFRNAHLLSIATSWAEVIGATKIFIGAVEEDSSGYPDCREKFYRAFNKAIEMGTKPETRIEIVTPLIHMKKSEIVKKGAELGAPLRLTWSCYQASEKACGRCESCALRLKGFNEAGVKDPIPYEG